MIIAHSMHGIQYLRLESCTDRMHIYACLCHVRQYQDFENHGMAWQQKSCRDSLVVGVVDNSPHDFSMKECSRLGWTVSIGNHIKNNITKGADRARWFCIHFPICFRPPPMHILSSRESTTCCVKSGATCQKQRHFIFYFFFNLRKETWSTFRERKLLMYFYIECEFWKFNWLIAFSYYILHNCKISRWSKINCFVIKQILKF